jgi:uncharacterized membrane protein
VATVDESAHLYRTYQVANGNFVPEKVSQNESGGSIPKGVSDLVTANVLPEKQNYTFGMIRQEASIRQGSEMLQIEFTNVSSYPFINYFPQAIGFRLAGLFTDRVLFQLYAARITNLLFLTMAVTFAMHVLPFGRRVFAVFAFMPMVLYAGASLSADVFLLSCAAVFSAFLVLLFQKQTISDREWIYLGLISGGLALGKQTYYILVLAVVALLFRRKRKPLPAEAWRVAAILLFVCLVVGLWGLIAHDVSSQPLQLQRSVGVFSEPEIQKQFILSNPLQFVRAALTTLDQQLFTTMFGSFGVGNIQMPVAMYYLLFLILFLALGFQSRAKSLGHGLGLVPSLLIAGVVAIHVVATMGGLYVYWTNPGEARVTGLQGRYFIPDLFLLVPVLMNRYSHTIQSRWVLAGSLTVLVVAIFSIFSHSYIL